MVHRRRRSRLIVMSEALGDNDADTFGSWLKSTRERTGMTQGELGAAAGMSGNQVGRYEQGKAFPRGANAARLAAALGVDPAEFNQALLRNAPGKSPAISTVDVVTEMAATLERLAAAQAQDRRLLEEILRLLESGTKPA